MRGECINPPRHGEGDRAKRGGGGSPPAQRPVVYGARKLRRTMTPPEIALWQIFRQRPQGIKFRRQHPIGPYVVDFCCLTARLVVEIDGMVHDRGESPAYDMRRTRFLEERGFTVMRIAASDVLADPVEVASSAVALAESPLHHRAAPGGPPPRAGEE